MPVNAHSGRRDPCVRTDPSSPLLGRETEAQVDRLSIAMVGTRGVPARYGGFETAVEEIGRRLSDSGHRVVVYCRTVPGAQEPPPA